MTLSCRCKGFSTVCWFLYSCVLFYRHNKVRFLYTVHGHSQSLTSLQSNLTTGLIADFSPVGAANGFVWSWHPLYCFLDPQESAAPKRHLDQFSRFLHGTFVWPIHRHTDYAKCDICRNRPHLCYACDAAYIVISTLQIFLSSWSFTKNVETRWLYRVKCHNTYSARRGPLSVHKMFTPCIRRCLMSRACDCMMSALFAVLLIFSFQFSLLFFHVR